ncbi:MAG: hypothetical protein C5B57_04725, partial [Blastocatellia bacterium]
PAAAPASAPAPAPSSSAPSSAGPTSSDGASARSGGGSSASGANSRRARDGEVVGTAVPRGSVPIDTGGGSVIFVPGGYGFYPWGWGGLGFGGYYGGFYDPWYGGYPATYYPVAQNRDEGALRLKVKPREASVYTDGYFVGKVDDFDGVLQKLHLSAGPHRIEIRDPKYETLSFDVRIETDQTLTYRGEMKKIQ